MIACYIGGAISDPKAMNVYKNINAGLELTATLINLGYAVFSPYSDYTYIMRTDCDIEDVYRYSIEMMIRCDCMVVVTETDYQHSHGLAEEIKVCKAKNIPIFYNLEDLAKFRRSRMADETQIV